MPLDTTYEKLKSMIYDRRLNAGQKIAERDLVRELGVSRIPVREGIMRLESEGLIFRIPNSSTYISPIGRQDIMEMYSMRLWLEPPATRLVTLKCPLGLIRQLNSICGKMAKAIDRGHFSRVDDYDYQFHYAIVRASGHTRLQRAYDATHIRIIGFYTDFLAQRTVDATLLVRQHQQIALAINRGDPAYAEKIAYNHVQRSITNFEKKLGAGLGIACEKNAQ